MAGIGRYRQAQDAPHDGFAAALEEIRAGEKRGHWIWYVFPQIDGLGLSETAHLFAVNGLGEAADFLREAVLRSRYLTMTRAVADQLTAGKLLRVLMGSDIDAKKVVSSLTLFAHVSRMLHDTEGVDACAAIAVTADRVLAMADAQGYPPCAYTLRRLREAR